MKAVGLFSEISIYKNSGKGQFLFDILRMYTFGQKTIEKDGATIEVIPLYKFLVNGIR